MLQNQIRPSPARLGFTNPNSPSISNPATPKQQTPSAVTLPTSTLTTITSSSLLSLLPPLPRAQSLLLQMSSLAPKLFEVSPNRASWFTSFRGSLPMFLTSQTLTLNPPPLDTSPTSPKEIISLFTSLQTQLFESVAELQEILDLQDAKQKIAREIKIKDAAILAFANKLREAERVLDVLVDDYSDYRRPKRLKFQGNSGEDTEMTSTNTSIATSLKLNDILSYAHKISYTTFAPPEFGAGQASLLGALPPAPQEEHMRASQLYNFANLDIGLPKVESNENVIEILVESPGLPRESNNLGDLAAIMPPAGLKRGDPVLLPSLGAHASCRAEEQQKQTHLVPYIELDIDKYQSDSGSECSSPSGDAREKGTEQFMVPTVQLDIPSGSSSEYSEYSSDEGSSEED
ncbi:hypothetical protein MKW94_000780 [Papaver nudicaule]|uniref:Mediator of RNA polymerase II transcription subunit 4 n=1 Tax=Papaver nudicaule TaxID=74823 RepID=A0AA41VMT2_PAPNU|nr:hypothetical protein [Papaver nudicaule]